MRWATELFEKLDAWFKNIYGIISVISIGELTKIGDSDALTFFFEDQGKNRSPRGAFFSGDRAKIVHPEVKTFF